MGTPMLGAEGEVGKGNIQNIQVLYCFIFNYFICKVKSRSAEQLPEAHCDSKPGRALTAVIALLCKWRT